MSLEIYWPSSDSTSPIADWPGAPLHHRITPPITETQKTLYSVFLSSSQSNMDFENNMLTLCKVEPSREILEELQGIWCFVSYWWAPSTPLNEATFPHNVRSSLKPMSLKFSEKYFCDAKTFKLQVSTNYSGTGIISNLYLPQILIASIVTEECLSFANMAELIITLCRTKPPE